MYDTPNHHRYYLTPQYLSYYLSYSGKNATL